MGERQGDFPVAQGSDAGGTSPVHEVAGLSKAFGNGHAVDDLNFSLAAGEFVGLLGPDGAGKTTTITMLTGLRHPSSGGMERRLVIVRALLHDPKILFLDEPTVGLDPPIRRDLWDLIIRINQSRKTAILLTTHDIEEAKRLCSRVLILNEGRLAAAGSPVA